MHSFVVSTQPQTACCFFFLCVHIYKLSIKCKTQKPKGINFPPIWFGVQERAQGKEMKWANLWWWGRMKQIAERGDTYTRHIQTTTGLSEWMGRHRRQRRTATTPVNTVTYTSYRALIYIISSGMNGISESIWLSIYVSKWAEENGCECHINKSAKQ